MGTLYITGSALAPVPRSYIAFAAGEDMELVLTLAPSPAGGIGGWTTQLTVLAQIGNAMPLFTVAGVVSDPTGAVLTLTIPAALTSALAFGPLPWSIRRTDSASNTLLAHGQLNLLPAPGGGV